MCIVEKPVAYISDYLWVRVKCEFLKFAIYIVWKFEKKYKLPKYLEK